MQSHRVRGRTPRLALLALVPGLMLGLTACGSSDGGRFDAGTAAYPLTCLQHQVVEPGPAYTDRNGRDTVAIFTMLKYFTANSGVSSYCDGKAPSGIDRLWAELYVDLGAEPRNVSHIAAAPR